MSKMSLIDKIPDYIAIKVTKLNEQEIELKNLLNECRKLFGRSIDQKDVDWDKYNSIMAKSFKLLDRYTGRFKNYFANSLRSFREEEKIILGY